MLSTRSLKPMAPDPRFANLLKEVASGKDMPSSAFLPWLAVSEPSARAAANREIVKAFVASGDVKKAKALAKRAFALSSYSLDTLASYVHVLEKIDDFEEIKEAHKRAGIQRADQGDIVGAIQCFRDWQRVYVQYKQIDKYVVDADILLALERLASPMRFQHPESKLGDPNRKISICYLVGYAEQPMSVLLKLDTLFIENYNRSKFSVTYAFLSAESALQALPHGQKLMTTLKRRGCTALFLPDIDDPLDRHMTLAKQLAASSLDILVTNAVLSETSWWGYFITALKPASKLISVIHGPIPQYSSPLFDHAICSFNVQLVDAPVPATQVNIELPIAPTQAAKDFRQHLGLPAQAVVLCCGGRYVKFQDWEYWKMIADILIRYPRSHLVVMGFTSENLPHFSELPADIRQRIHFVGWTNNIGTALAATDIYLDSYPTGGGVLFMEALARNIPAVSFRHNYFAMDDGYDVSGAEDILGNYALIAERGNFEQFASTVGQLIDESKLRQSSGKQMGEYFRQTRNNPQRMVRRYEDVYLTVARAKTPVVAGSHPVANYETLSQRLQHLTFRSFLTLSLLTLGKQVERVLRKIFVSNRRS